MEYKSLMKKVLRPLILAFLVNIPLLITAQEYKTAVGAMWGGSVATGITAKHFLSTGKDKGNSGIEVIVLSLYRGFMVYGLYERQSHIITGDQYGGFSYYYGAGMHFGNFEPVAGYCKTDGLGRFTKIGIDGVIGIEYELDYLFGKYDVPFVMSVDVKPFFDVVGSDCGGIWAFGTSLRYIFGGFSFK